MYEAREQLDILKELQGYSQVDASKIEGTFEYDVLSSNSIEFAKTEVELEEAYKAAFLNTANGDYLTMRASECGVERRQATNAVATVIVSGTVGAVVPAGSLFATADGTRFYSDAEATVGEDGTVEISVTASETGEQGNVMSGAITEMPISIPRITSVTNELAAHDGYDEEDDETLRERALEHVRNPGTSGNPRQYVEWALSISGVGAAKCLRAWNGPNTVKLVIVDDDFDEASELLQQKVYDYIDELRTVNAILTVSSAKAKTIDIAAKITGSVDEEQFQQDVKSYFASIEKKSWDNSSNVVVTCNKIGAMLIEAGADDYSELTLNGESKNITMDTEEMPKIGVVNLSG